MCTLCSSVITSEVYLLSHLCSFRHKEALKEHHKQDVSQEESETYNLKFIINAPANIDEMQVKKFFAFQRKKESKNFVYFLTSSRSANI